MIVLVNLCLIIFMFSGNLRAAEAETPNKGDAPEPTQKRVEAETTKWLLPWEKGVSYEFSWHLGNKKTGKSKFQLDWSEEKQLISCKGELELAKQGSELKGIFCSTFKQNLEPVTFIKGFSSKMVGQSPGDSGIVVSFSKEDIKIRVGSIKGETESIPRSEKMFYLSGGQAIHHWALFLPLINRNRKSTVHVFMPQIREFLDITFTPDGKETTRGLDATKLKFNVTKSKTGQTIFFGTVWTAPDGRLLRYRQPNATSELNVWITKKSLK